MGRLRTILVLRGVLALFLVGLGGFLVIDGDVLFGLLAVVAGVVNAGLVAMIARRARDRG